MVRDFLFSFAAALLLDYATSCYGKPYSPNWIKITQRATVSFVLWEAAIALISE